MKQPNGVRVPLKVSLLMLSEFKRLNETFQEEQKLINSLKRNLETISNGVQ